MASTAGNKGKKFFRSGIFCLFFQIVIQTLFLSLFVLKAGAEFEDKGPGVRAGAMGGAYVALADDHECLFYNPAGAARMRGPEFGTMHTSLYSLKDLSHDYLAFVQPLPPFATMGLAWEGFGGGLYRERTDTFIIARKVNPKINLGLNLKVMSTRIAGTPDRHAFGADFGTIVELEKNFSVGVSVMNLNNPVVNEVVPRRFRAGCAFRPIEPLVLTLDYAFEQGDDGSINVGEEFEVARNVKLRAGYSSRPGRLTAGFGFHFRYFRVDYGFRNHEVLDNTHTVSATFFMD